MHLCPMAFTEDTTALSTTQTLRHRQPVVNPVSKTKQIGAAIKSCHLSGGGKKKEKHNLQRCFGLLNSATKPKQRGAECREERGHLVTHTALSNTPSAGQTEGDICSCSSFCCCGRRCCLHSSVMMLTQGLSSGGVPSCQRETRNPIWRKDAL